MANKYLTVGNNDNLGDQGVYLGQGGDSAGWRVEQVPGQPNGIYRIQSVVRSNKAFTSGSWLAVNGSSDLTIPWLNLWYDAGGDAAWWRILTPN
jgi:hypothetical protein